MASLFSSRPFFQGFSVTATKVSLCCLSLTIGFTCWAQTEIKAKKAQSFVDSMGVNVHLESPFPPYYSKNYSLIDSELQLLGMHHIRDEINDTDDTFVQQLNHLGTLGYSVCGLIEGGNDYPGAGKTLNPSLVGPMIENLHTLEAVEGPNEPDDNPPPFVYGCNLQYPQGAVDESKDLWDIVQDNPKISHLPVLAMSEGTSSDFRKLADSTNHAPVNYANFGNMHAYQGGLVGDSGLTNTYIADVRAWVGKSKPLWTTEMGYHNYTKYLGDGEQQGVSQRASAIYLPIAFLSGFNANVVQTFSYELLDEVDDPQLMQSCKKQSPSGIKYCSGEGHYGLLNFDGTPKPAFMALKNLIEILRDPEAKEFDPGSLDITFVDAPASMRYTLLEKSNGDYYLAIWNDKQVYQLATATSPGMDKYPPSVRVTIDIHTPQTFTVYAPNDKSGINPTDAYTISTTSSSIQIDLPAKVLSIKISHNS